MRGCGPLRGLPEEAGTPRFWFRVQLTLSARVGCFLHQVLGSSLAFKFALEEQAKSAHHWLEAEYQHLWSAPLL